MSLKLGIGVMKCFCNDAKLSEINKFKSDGKRGLNVQAMAFKPSNFSEVREDARTHIKLHISNYI